MVEQHYTLADAARLLRVSRRTVVRLVSEGRATRGARGLWPVVRIGRLARVPESALRRLGASCRDA